MFRAVLVAALVVLAGCSVGLDRPAGGQETVTPAPKPSLERPAASQSVGPWLFEGGVIDSEALADTHEAQLTGTAYRVDERFVRRQYGYHISNVRIVENATTWIRTDGVVRRDRTRHRIPLAAPENDWWENITALQTGGERFVVIRRNGSRTYERNRSFEQPYVDTAETIRWALNVENATVEPFEANGTTYYRIESDEPATPTLRWTTDYEVSAVVEQSGFVHRLAIEYTYRQFGELQRVSYVVTIDRANPSAVPNWTVGPRP